MTSFSGANVTAIMAVPFDKQQQTHDEEKPPPTSMLNCLFSIRGSSFYSLEQGTKCANKKNRVLFSNACREAKPMLTICGMKITFFTIYEMVSWNLPFVLFWLQLFRLSNHYRIKAIFFLLHRS